MLLQEQEVALQSLSRSNLQGKFQGPLGRCDVFVYGLDAGVHFPPLVQGKAGDHQGQYQVHHQPELGTRLGNVDF